MWTNQPEPNSDEGDYAEYLAELRETIDVARRHRDRESHEYLFNLFTRTVRARQTIPDDLLHYVANTLEELAHSRQAKSVADVLGHHPSGMRASPTIERERIENEIARQFIYNKKGRKYSYEKNIAAIVRGDDFGEGKESLRKRAREAGVGMSERNIRYLIRKRATTNPAFSYSGTSQRPGPHIRVERLPDGKFLHYIEVERLENGQAVTKEQLKKIKAMREKKKLKWRRQLLKRTSKGSPKNSNS